MTSIISATGLWTPTDSISNEELVESFNAWANKWNAEHAAKIEAGTVEEQPISNAPFIEKASGIKSRYVISKASILDPDIMSPRFPARDNTQISLLAEIGLKACQDALAKAGKIPDDIDGVIVACSNLQRAYPAIAIEVQDALGMKGGFGFDMNVACSAATFGIETARGLVNSGQARAILVVNPEICSAHLNFRDRDSHFIFGDVATATLVEADNGQAGWEIIGTKLITQFSNNIRNNFGFLNRAAPKDASHEGEANNDKLFKQNGRSVFKEVCPMVAELITTELAKADINVDDLKRMWLHQANLAMNTLIAKKVLKNSKHDFTPKFAPVILDQYANTSSAGSIIAFNKHSDDFKSGDIGLICSFGAGYSAGLIIVRKR